MQNITKQFPGVKALNGVSFSCQKGEVHALLGENGAGKSTLMKILGGAYQPDSGEVIFNGKKFHHESPVSAQRAGISVIYQEFNLVPHMNVVENIFLGKEVVRAGLLNYRQMRKQAEELLKDFKMQIDLSAKIKDLSIAQCQMIEIAKALSFNADLLVMDEPTATLTERETDRLFELVAELKQRGVTIIYISHRLEEIFKIADRATVLKDGCFVGTCEINQTSTAKLINMMVGRDLQEIYPKRGGKKGEPLLEVRNISRHRVLNDISFKAYRGEILGISGLVGSGRTELARIIFGADAPDSGEIVIGNEKVIKNTPRKAISKGIGFATEDRKNQGLILEMTIQHNTSLSLLKRISKFGLINFIKEKIIVNSFMKKMNIKASRMDVKVRNLSGGNQQKVVLAKWLATDCDLIILDEPTRGIDVGAKVEIYQLMRDLADQQKAVIMISSELPEILGASDRILVMREGELVAEMDAEDATEHKIITKSTGG